MQECRNNLINNNGDAWVVSGQLPYTPNEGNMKKFDYILVLSINNENKPSEIFPHFKSLEWRMAFKNTANYSENQGIVWTIR